MVDGKTVTIEDLEAAVDRLSKAVAARNAVFRAADNDKGKIGGWVWPVCLFSGVWLLVMGIAVSQLQDSQPCPPGTVLMRAGGGHDACVPGTYIK